MTKLTDIIQFKGLNCYFINLRNKPKILKPYNFIRYPEKSHKTYITK